MSPNNYRRHLVIIGVAVLILTLIRDSNGCSGGSENKPATTKGTTKGTTKEVPKGAKECESTYVSDNNDKDDGTSEKNGNDTDVGTSVQWSGLCMLN